MLITATLQLSCSRMNPAKDFPWTEHGKTLVWRCIFGQFVFLVFNFCLKLVPLTFQMIIFQTSTFWISILAYCFLNETMLPLEIISMVISFAAMVVITVTGAHNASENEGNLAEEFNYSSFTVWNDKANFDAWRKGEAFKEAHGGGDRSQGKGDATMQGGQGHP